MRRPDARTWRKFSHVLGTSSPYRPKVILPAGLPPARFESRQLHSRAGRVARGGAPARTNLCEGRASARDGRGAAQRTHRDVKEHLAREGAAARASAHGTRRSSRGGWRVCRRQRSAVYRRVAAGAHARIPHLLGHLGGRRDGGGRESAAPRVRVSQLKRRDCAWQPRGPRRDRRSRRRLPQRSHEGASGDAPARGGRGAASRGQRRRQAPRAQLGGAHDSGRHRCGRGGERAVCALLTWRRIGEERRLPCHVSPGGGGGQRLGVFSVALQQRVWSGLLWLLAAKSTRHPKKVASAFRTRSPAH